MFVSRMRTESSVLPCRGPLTQEDAQQGANQENDAGHSGITPLLGKAQHELITDFPLMRATFLSVQNLLISCRSSSYFMHASLKLASGQTLYKVCAACFAGGKSADAAGSKDEKGMPVALTVPSPSGSGLGDIDAGLCCQASITLAFIIAACSFMSWD